MPESRAAKLSRRALLRSALLGAAGLGASVLLGCQPSSDNRSPGATGKATGPAGPTSPSSANAPIGPSGPASPTAERRWVRAHQTVEPPARRDASLTAAGPGGLLFVFGGRAQGMALGDLWICDPAQARCYEPSISGAKPSPRFGHVAVYDATQERLIIALGQAGPTTFLNDVWAFDPARSTWREISGGSDERPTPRYGAGDALDRTGRRLFISHGFTNQGRFDDTWVFDLTNESWQKVPTSGPVPVKRCLLRCGWDPGSGQLLLYGGQSDGAPFLGDFWVLDPVTGTWTEKKPTTSPGPRNFYGATFVDAARRWYLVGGATPNGPAGDVWEYDVQRDIWTRLPDLPDGPGPRDGHDVTSAGTELALFGGHNGTAELSDFWTLPIGA